MLSGCACTTPALTQVQTITIKPPTALLTKPVEPITLEQGATFEDVLKVNAQNGLEWARLRMQVFGLIEWAKEVE
jgi:hypothetical protein